MRITVTMKKGGQYRTVKDIVIRCGAYMCHLPEMTEDDLLRVCIEIENTLASVEEGLNEEEGVEDQERPNKYEVLMPGIELENTLEAVLRAAEGGSEDSNKEQEEWEREVASMWLTTPREKRVTVRLEGKAGRVEIPVLERDQAIREQLEVEEPCEHDSQVRAGTMRPADLIL